MKRISVLVAAVFFSCVGMATVDASQFPPPPPPRPVAVAVGLSEGVQLRYSTSSIRMMTAG